MDLSKILTIAGKGGLHEVVTQSKTGLIVQSLETGKKTPVFASDRSSSLEDISLFTTGEDVPLKEVLLKVFDKEEGKSCPVNTSDPSAMKKYFGEVLPEYDRDRVYMSDIKKVLTWYNILLEKGLIVKEEEEKAEEKAAEQATEPAAEQATEQSTEPAPKPAPKKTQEDKPE
jgi:pyruvate/2-oxoglutarate dehydrogenase complex dihydrolipoamide acyltransferase (E2) component